MVEQVIEDFKQILPSLDSRNFTVIHGDLNEGNILVSGGEDPVVTGIIDFQDVHGAAAIFDLAIFATYVLLETDPDLTTPKHLIRGYESICPLKDEEKDLIPILVASRLTQSLVIGAYSYSQTPEEYLLKTAKNGWEILTLLRKKLTHESIKELWFS